MTAFPFRKAHFIGLAGVGIERHCYPAARQRRCRNRLRRSHLPADLAGAGSRRIRVPGAYAAQNIPDDADLIVIGKNARLVPSEKDEVAEAFARAARPEGRKFCPSPKCSRFFRVDARTLWWRNLSARRRAFR